MPDNANAINIPAVLEKAKWVPIRDDWCDHLLDKATEVDTGDGLVWIRKTHNPTQLYTAKPDGNRWHCAKCGSVLCGATIAHTVRDGLFPCSGSGEVKYEIAPFCPTCEKKPGFHGSPTTET